jgi:hypothetical protein
MLPAVGSAAVLTPARCVCCPQDQFDTIDLSDNAIVRLEGFPRLPRLKFLLLNNNRIAKIARNLEGVGSSSSGGRGMQSGGWQWQGEQRPAVTGLPTCV